MNGFLTRCVAVGAGGLLVAGAGMPVAAGARAPVSGGTWGMAQEVHGPAELGESWVASVSCASPANCSAGGYYSTPAPRAFPVHAFVVSQKNGSSVG